MAITNLTEIAARSAEAHPHATALRFNGAATSYAELDALANRLASTLAGAGVAPGDRVGVLGFKSPAVVAATQGILRADAVYVPLDPRAPATRLAAICADCGITTVVADANVQRHLAELPAHGVRTVVALEGGVESAGATVIPWATVATASPSPRPLRRGTDDLAYVLYTSGSTGQPKGVMISHENALSFVRWALDHFDVRTSDRLLNSAPLTFDLPVFDLYAGFWAGATVVLLPETTALFPAATVRTIVEEDVTSLYMVPSVFIALMNRGGLLDLDPGRIRRILYSGEAFPVPQLRRLREWAPDSALCNLYGPIETNACTYFDVTDVESDWSSVPIGRPIAGIEIALCDPESGASATTDAGEICVAGGSVALGYWGNAQLTSTKWMHRDGRTFYRTGDLGRRDETGTLWFQGRKDSMVKSRGFRIELGEVEHAIASHPDVVEAAVIAVPDPEIGSVLYGWYVPTAGGLERARIKSHLAQILPTYMVPREVFSVDMLPKTSTGKISRRDLEARLAKDRA